MSILLHLNSSKPFVKTEDILGPFSLLYITTVFVSPLTQAVLPQQMKNAEME